MSNGITKKHFWCSTTYIPNRSFVFIILWSLLRNDDHGGFNNEALSTHHHSHKIQEECHPHKCFRRPLHYVFGENTQFPPWEWHHTKQWCHTLTIIEHPTIVSGTWWKVWKRQLRLLRDKLNMSRIGQRLASWLAEEADNLRRLNKPIVGQPRIRLVGC